MLAKTLQASGESIRIAAALIKKGKLVAFPTDTVYGLGCDPFSKAAVSLLFEAKDRVAKPVPVLCEDFEAASNLVVLDGRAGELGRKYWPGPFTIVAPLKTKVPPLLDQKSGWLGVRVPGREDCLALLRGVGGCLTGTSANLSGKPSCRTAEEVRLSLGERVSLILDGGRLEAPESTVVKVVGDDVEVLRRGNIGLESRRSERGKRTSS